MIFQLNNYMKKNCIAFFDFDGTITKQDTFLEFIKYSKGYFNFYTGFFLLSPIIFLFKIKFIPNWKAKELVLTYFFKDTCVDDFEKSCLAFSEKIIPKLVRTNALYEIKKHLNNETRVVVVSASPENWLKHWCEKHKLELIGTNLEICNGKITGNILNKNCYGIEKVNRINEVINLKEYLNIYAYGDSNGDKQMLKIATHAYYKYF